MGIIRLTTGASLGLLFKATVNSMRLVPLRRGGCGLSSYSEHHACCLVYVRVVNATVHPGIQDIWLCTINSLRTYGGFGGSAHKDDEYMRVRCRGRKTLLS